MSKVLLIDTKKRPLDPIHSAQARQLLRNGKAAVFRRYPFTFLGKVEGINYKYCTSIHKKDGYSYAF